VRVIGCGDSTVFDARADCTTRADSDSDSHAVCKHARSDEDYHTNMDKITREHLDKHSQKYGGTHSDKYPYIDFDEDGNAYVVTERDAIPYTYATDDSEREKYPDAASIDTITPGKRGKRGGPNANRRNANK
jgi:hypothetical protein